MMRYLLLTPALLLLGCCGIQGEQGTKENGTVAQGAQGNVTQGAQANGGNTTPTKPTGTGTTGNGTNGNGTTATGTKGTGTKGTGTKGTGTKGTDVVETEVKGNEGGSGLPVDQTGWNAADLQVYRGAQAMLQAEKRLKELLKAGKISGIDRIVPFEEIASWPYEDALKGMPKRLKKLDGKLVLMTGFMLPIDEVENIREFLLVQSLWSCCYGQPPDINGVVRVIMQGKKRLDYEFEPIKIVGKFKISPTLEDGFCVDIYQLEAKSVEILK